MALKRQKVTVPPPALCEPPCYHTARAFLLEKYIKRLRLELIKSRAELMKARKVKAKAKLEAEVPDLDKAREDSPKDLEVVDLVDQFNRRRSD